MTRRTNAPGGHCLHHLKGNMAMNHHPDAACGAIAVMQLGATLPRGTRAQQWRNAARKRLGDAAEAERARDPFAADFHRFVAAYALRMAAKEGLRQ